MIKRTMIAGVLALATLTLNAQQNNDAAHLFQQSRLSDINWMNAERMNPETHLQNILPSLSALPDKGTPTGNYRLLGNRYDSYNTITSAWVFGDSSVYSYNANGLNNFIITKIYNTTLSTWDNYYRSTNTFTSEGWVSLYIGETWSGSAWVNDDKEETTYNAIGQVTQFIDYNWSGSAWVEYYKETYSYNSNDLVEYHTIFYWNTITSTWDPNTRYTYSYDANGNTIMQLTQTWNGSAWVNYYRYNYTFNASNKNTSYRSLSWNSVLSVWDNSYRDTTIYNAGGYIRNAFIWNTVTSTWDNYSVSTATTSVSDMILTYLTQYWNSSLSVFENYYRYTYSYDANDNFLTSLTESWDATNTIWKNYYRYTSAYNADNYILYYLNENWDDATTSWVNSSRTYYRYEINPFAGINDLSAAYQTNLYPNPSQDFTTLQLTVSHMQDIEISVLTLDGKLVTQQILTQVSGQIQHVLYTQGWDKGVYMVRIHTRDGFITQKLIVQ